MAQQGHTLVDLKAIPILPVVEDKPDSGLTIEQLGCVSAVRGINPAIPLLHPLATSLNQPGDSLSFILDLIEAMDST